MRAYRLYYIGRDGHYADVSEIIGENDDAAIAIAANQARRRPAELWERYRRVKVFPAPPKGRPHLSLV
jgi:hypothetical protein